MPSENGHAGPTWADCWEALSELEGRVGRSAEVRLWRPSGAQKGWTGVATVAVTVVVTRGGTERSRTRRGYLGGTRGSRTMPAALLRAVNELVWSLDDDETAQAEQAAF